MHSIPEKLQNKSYGLFGFEGNVVDDALFRDLPENLKEAIHRGYIESDSRTLYGKTIAQRAREIGAERCVEYLLSIGWK